MITIQKEAAVLIIYSERDQDMGLHLFGLALVCLGLGSFGKSGASYILVLAFDSI